MSRHLKLASLAIITAASMLVFAPTAQARRGADNPAGDVRQQDRATEVRAVGDIAAHEIRREDRAAEVRPEANEAMEARQVHEAIEAPEAANPAEAENHSGHR